MKSGQQAEPPINLFWWNQKKNFGDVLSKLVVSHVSGRSVQWSSTADCDMIAAGSIVNQLRAPYKNEVSRRPVVWGSGLMGPVRLDFVSNVEFHAVRGPATMALLNLKSLPHGDPGLLLAELATDDVLQGDDIGIVPHWTDFRSEETRPLILELKQRQGVKIIDPRSDDPLAVARQIRACRHIFSASLHGLIIADSHNVPNTWVASRDIHKFSQFKFLDYFLSVGRPWSPPITYDQIPAEEASKRSLERIAYKTGVDDCKEALVEAFPSYLSAQPGAEKPPLAQRLTTRREAFSFNLRIQRATPDTWTASQLPTSTPEVQSLQTLFDQIEQNAAKAAADGAFPLWDGYAELKDYPTATTKSATRTSNDVRTERNMGQFFSWMVTSLKPSEIVEVGSAFGVSGMYWCAGLVANGSGNFTGFEPNKQWALYARSNIKSVMDRARLIEGVFEESADELPNSIDLAFIDAIHTPEFVETQLKILLERAQKSALIVLDDINFSSSMSDYWKEIQKDSQFSAAFEIGKRVGVLELG